MKSPLIILQRINGLYNTLKHENWTLRWNEIIILSVLLYFSIFFHFFFLAISIQFWKNFQNSRHVFETPCSHIPKDQVKHSLENGNTIKARDKCAETICARLQLRERENRIILQLPKELNLISLLNFFKYLFTRRNTRFVPTLRKTCHRCLLTFNSIIRARV